MKSKKVIFGGVRIDLVDGWYDVTDDLEPGSPKTLGRSPSAFGALQLSFAYYRKGARPHVSAEILNGMLERFGKKNSLDLAPICPVEYGEVFGVRSSCKRAEIILVWFLSNGEDVLLVTYVADDSSDPGFKAEIDEVEYMVQSMKIVNEPNRPTG